MSRRIVAKPGHSSKRSWGRTWRCSDLRAHKACGLAGIRFAWKHAWISHENGRRRYAHSWSFLRISARTFMFACTCKCLSSVLLGEGLLNSFIVSGNVWKWCSRAWFWNKAAVSVPWLWGSEKLPREPKGGWSTWRKNHDRWELLRQYTHIYIYQYQDTKIEDIQRFWFFQLEVVNLGVARSHFK